MKLNVTTARRVALVAVLIAAAAAALLLAAGPGHRFGFWHYRTSFTLMEWAAYLGLGAAAASIPAAVLCFRWRVGIFPSLVALVLGVASAWLPWHQLRMARSLPPIHDITTDTDRPPEFSAVVARRSSGSNPLEYGGAELAAQQKAAYPDVVPLQLALPLPDAFGRAVAAAKTMGWEVVSADGAQGRIEATATTFWFGFMDDVVIRISGEGTGSRVDVRSVSRVGKSDLGANAARIRAYLSRLKESA